MIVVTVFDKLDAIRILCPGATPTMQHDRLWVLHTPYVEIAANGMLGPMTWGLHPTPEAAVNAGWDYIMEEMRMGHRAVKHAMSRKNRREYRWTGAEWERVPRRRPPR